MYDSQNVDIALSRIYNEQVKNEENRTGFYRAIVVNNKDDDNLGRVQIRIPAFHGSNSEQTFYISDDRLPYAYPASLNAAGNQSGQFLLPLVGSLVWVSFETGTDNFVYFGGVYTAEPTGNRYIYFDRSTNNGEAMQITEDDIPSNYDPNRYVLYRSPKGAEIVIDERDRIEDVEIIDQHGNKITLNRNGASVISDGIFSANFPYLHTYFIDHSYASMLPQFQVDVDKIFNNVLLTTNDIPSKGSRLMYIKSGECVGTGIVLSVINNKATISNNGYLINGGGGGTDDYNNLNNLPSINSTTLRGNRDLAENPLTNRQIEELLR